MSASSQPVVTPDDYSSIPSIISWFLGVTSVLFVATKIVTKLSMTRSFALDDAAIITALAFSIGMVIAVSIQAQNGLGKRESSLSESDLIAFEKGVYATGFLYITTLFFSKSSVLVLLRALTPVRNHQLLTYAVAGVLGLWAISGLFTVGFQCSTPQKWAVVTGHCINRASFWIVFGILNIITEVFLVVIPAVIMRSVQIPQKKKTVIIIVFSLRVFVAAAIIPELIFVHRAGQSADRTFAAWPAVVCALFVQCLSIVFACVPYLKPFFGALESGMIRMDDTRRREGRSTGGGGYYFKKAKVSSHGSSSGKQSIGSRLYPLRNFAHGGGGTHSASAERGPEDMDRHSQRSDSRIIRATTTFEVRSEDEF
ncbi:hypothetical protein FJTKL_04137 [Diaporthe vaccinii]|uniref:Rhodopsin domain-containing protein n=1 Tax=Diaporthe vaccinii TaxID=105482 RepID=A0ABR4DU42_9PEZI